MSIKKFARNKPIMFLIIIFFCICSAAGITGGSYLLTFAINSLKKGAFHNFISITIGFASTMFLGYLFSIVSKYLFNIQSQNYIHSIRSQIIKSDYNSYQSIPVSKIQNKLTNDLNILSSDYLDKILSAFNQILSILFSCIALITMHWSLLLLVFALTIVMLFAPKLLSKPLQEATLKLSNKNKDYINNIEKWLGGLSEIKRYKSYEKLTSILEMSSKNLEKSTIHRYGVQNILNLINLFFNIFSQGSVLVLAGFLVYNKIVSFGVIFTASQFASFIFNGIVEISNSFGSIISTKSLNKEINSYMFLPKKNNSNYIDPKKINSISTSNLSIKYLNGETLVFPDIDIISGDKILLTGDSGSGKSTLFKLLIGDLKPTTGQIIYKDFQNNQVLPDPYEIGYIPQDATIFPASIEDNITMFNDSLKKNLSEILDIVELSNDIVRFPEGIETELNLDDPNYSGGQRQKIILARALIHKKTILMIDEGTSAIDADTTLKILNNLIQFPTTIIFIAHNFNKKMTSLFQKSIHISKK